METKTPKTPLIKSLNDAALRDHYWSCRELAYNNMQMVGHCGRRSVDKLGRQMGWLMKQINICEAVARQRKISLAQSQAAARAEATQAEKITMAFYAKLATEKGFSWVWKKDGTLELTWPDRHVAELTVEEFYRYVREWA